MFFFQKSSPDYFSDPDVQRMLKFQQGDAAAFEALMRKYFKPLVNFLYKMILSQSAAEDLAQETFLKVYREKDRYVPKAQFKTWLYTIARHLCLNELRKRSVRNVSMDDKEADGQTLHDHLPDGGVHALEALSREENADFVRQALEKLPAQQKMAVVLRRYDGFSYEDIARVMGLSPQAVKSLLNRAKEFLAVELSKVIDK